MISKNKQSRLAGFRILLAIPTAFVLLMLFSFTSLEKNTSIIKINILKPSTNAVQSSIDKPQNISQKIDLETASTFKTKPETIKTSQQNPDPPKYSQSILVKTIEGIDKYFPGGSAVWLDNLKKNFKYPAEDGTGGPQGTVSVSFIVTETGEIESVSLFGKSGIGMNMSDVDAACEKEAVRAVSLLPKVEPIIKNGKPQRVEFILPVFLATYAPHPITSPNTYSEPPLENAEKQPEFKGGNDAMLEFIASNMQYPAKAVEKGTQGVVYVKFVVDKTGKLTNIQAERGLGRGCDEEAVRIIKSMPDWNPGLNKGEQVNVKQLLMIKFKLKATYTTIDNAQN